MKAEPKVASMAGAGGKPEARGRSTIEFPYLDLENALEIAQGVHAAGGSGCEWDQLAAHLKQAAQGGGFRLRMIASKQFGLVTYDRGKITLTSLGLRAVDPQQAKAAKVEAFLTIPLYKALYDKFRGATLPPVAGLEREMQSLGVATKQTDKARQAFSRSAKTAGFFDFGADRLVAPALSSVASKPAQTGPGEASSAAFQQHRGSSGGNNGGNGGNHDNIPAAILGLLSGLPTAGTPMSAKKRESLVAAFRGAVEYIYADKSDE